MDKDLRESYEEISRFMHQKRLEEIEANCQALEFLVRAIEDIRPQLHNSPLVRQIANDILDILDDFLCGEMNENPLRAEQRERRNRARLAAYKSHAKHNAQRREIQAAWLELERTGSKKSKAQFAEKMADKYGLSFETVRRWLRDSELKAARSRIKIIKVAPNPESGPSMQG